MNSFFRDIGIHAVDFVYISTVFLLTMATFFGVKKKDRWLSYVITGLFAIICSTTILFRQALNLRLFAALMLITAAIVEVVATRRRKHENADDS